MRAGIRSGLAERCMACPTARLNESAIAGRGSYCTAHGVSREKRYLAGGSRAALIGFVIYSRSECCMAAVLFSAGTSMALGGVAQMLY